MAVKKQFFNSQEFFTSTNIPVLVIFYTTWCGLCQLMSPILEQVKSQMGELLHVVKINIDNFPKLSSKYQIQSLPTLILFQNGEPVLRIECVLQASQLN